MSDELEDDVGDQEPAEDVDEGDQPDIENDEMADFSSFAEEIEETAGAGAEDDQEDDASDDVGDQDDSRDSASATTSSSGPSVTAGDVYCNAMGMGAAVARASYGSADSSNRSDLVDQYADMARDLQIDEYVDEWLAEQGGIDELSPGQAIVVSTTMFAGLVAMDDPEMIENVAQGVGA